MNLSGLQAYTTAFPFVDLFKQSSPWISGTADVWNDNRPVDVDEHGWLRSLRPGQIVRSVFIDSGIPAPRGRYTVTYDGEGTIDFLEGARVIERAPGRLVIEVDPSRGNCYLEIATVNARNPIREIRILLPGRSADEVFNPVWLERIRPFKVLRPMCWLLGDNPEQISQPRWGDRPMMDDARWTEHGVPAEHMIDLANQVDADFWVSIPHDAEDGYVRGFAALLRDRLAPGRKVYVEHSNEVWNNTFTSYRYATERGLALGLSADPDQARSRYHARRSREIWAIFDEILGPERVVNVLAAQTDGPYIAEELLGYEETARHVEALAIGAYFGFEYGQADSRAATARMTVDDLIRDIEAHSIPMTLAYVRENVSIARRHGIPVVAYEGGQHLNAVMVGGDDPAIEALFDAANRDPRMGRLYAQLLAGWDAATGHGLFLHLNECNAMGPFGRWGLLERIDQPREAAPKYDAVMRWMEGR